MDIYIKPVKKFKIAERKVVYLRDVAEVYCPSGRQEDVSSTIVLNITKNEKRTYLVSVMDIIKQISNKLSDTNVTVNNVGEMDILVEYSPKHKKDNAFMKYLKVVVVSVILFMGGATAIMSFHSDAEMPQIMKNYYETFFGEIEEFPLVLEIPYSIGLGVGIIVFFNHFSKIKITQDPTPLEVQMSTYENEVIGSVVDALDKENKNGGS